MTEAADRHALSDAAWDRRSVEAYARYRAVHPAPDAPPIARTGIFDEGRLSVADTEALSALFFECPIIPYSVADVAEGYTFDPTGSLETYNTYRRMTRSFESRLGDVLETIAPRVEEICGHHVEVVQSHIWSLNGGPRRYQWHVDGWPVALKKLFIFPGGVDEHKGSTAFRLKTGEETVLDGPPGTWVIFENSVVEHKGIEPIAGGRPTVAISLAPALGTNVRLFDAGVNAGYPWFPKIGGR